MTSPSELQVHLTQDRFVNQFLRRQELQRSRETRILNHEIDHFDADWNFVRQLLIAIRLTFNVDLLNSRVK